MLNVDDVLSILVYVRVIDLDGFRLDNFWDIERGRPLNIAFEN